MPVRKNMKNNLIPPSPVKVVLLEEEKEAQMKQGIVTILGSDFCHGNKSGAASIRRTLSADMSSKKWLQENGFFSPIKNISSSSPPSPSSSSSSSSSEGEEENEENPGQDDVWRKIQEQKQRDDDDDDDDQKKKKPLLKMDVWGTMILTNKSENSAVLAAAAAAAPPPPPPYVHPLVKRSASTLSEKSLEICTESLGSETGSDCFSADVVEDRERAHVMPVAAVVVGDSNSYADVHVAKYKKSPTRPFPPPLPSITGGDGAALHVQSHRENGRLVLEAVSVPQRNHFHAQRCDGRLVLTLVHVPPSSELMVEEMFDNMEEVDEDVTDDDEAEVTEAAAEAEENIFQAQSVRKEKEYMVEQNLSLPSGIMSLNKSPMVIKKLMAVGNMNMNHSKWSQNLNKVAEEEIPIPHSLPPPPRVARLIPAAAAAPPAAASFNAYEYFWRNKTAVYNGGTHLKNKNNDGGGGAKGCENEEMVVVKVKKTEYSVPYIRGCKEARRSMSIWEPYCIATS